MLKRSLIAIAVVALLATVAPAGEIKLHTWPCALIAQEITQIPVKMDIGYWIRIKDQGSLSIKLAQLEGEIHKFKGCTDMKVETNFKVELSASISSTGAVGGSYGVSLDPSILEIGNSTVKVCATLNDANLGAKPAGSKNVHVATVKIKVVPI
jgi:hypothetical protein